MAVYLIPCPITENGMADIPLSTLHTLHSLQYFVVERAKTARHFIKKSEHPMAISDLIIEEMAERDHSWKNTVKTWLKQNISFGIISEAGCPGVADPGAEVVAMAHQLAIPVFPLTGPSSILLALMSSGFNGQSFIFHGYLPNKKDELIPALKRLEKQAQTGTTQIFMEAPYRNAFMLETITSSLAEQNKLCVACDILDKDQRIHTKTIAHWKSEDFSFFHKKPCIYILGK